MVSKLSGVSLKSFGKTGNNSEYYYSTTVSEFLIKIQWLFMGFSVFRLLQHHLQAHVILLLPLIQEGLVSVTSESICMKLSQACPGKSEVRLSCSLTVSTIAVDWDINPKAIKNLQVQAGRYILKNN